MSRRRVQLITSAVLLVPITALAATPPTIEGIVDRDFYGNPLSVQGVRTQFGDNNPTPPGPYLTWADGSELDAAYARIDNGVLYLMFTGNLQSNYNKLEIFFDTGTAGQNTIRRDNADVNFNALGRLGENLDGTNLAGDNPELPPDDPSQTHFKLGKGLTFDADFESTHYMTVNCGYDGGANDFRLYADFATTPADPTTTPSTGFFVGGSTPENNRLVVGASDILVASDNSNNLGVLGGDTAPETGEDVAAVNTGIEIRIPLSVLGNPTGDIKISAFINGTSHDFLSNQILGPVVPNPNFGNLGEPRTVDFSTLDGNQYFTVAMPSTQVSGDADGDGDVDLDDQGIWAANFTGSLEAGTGTGTFATGDFDGDKDVDLDDQGIWASNFTGSLAPGGLLSVPEPGSLLAAAGWVGTLLANRRARRSRRS